ncbi:MAG: HAD-IIB family hydrolase [Rhodopseudomonas sp.]|nr:HAD-IIB family hydrolase [Rhodopseudomonas sp.]
MKQKQFVLATDLDGTFLGGSDTDRNALYRFIEDRRGDVGLIFVTGRDPQFIERLCADGRVPWPDYVVGDVGTTIAEIVGASRKVRPLAALEADIAELWNDNGDRIRTLLNKAAGLTLQDTPFRYRVSYHFDPKTYDGAAERIVRHHGFDALISADRFFDVLPPGVSKGPSLRRLLKHLGVADDRVLVAGDTLNDLSLFETGLRGVAVANSEAALIASLRDRGNAYRAATAGAGGIAEAIRHFNFFSKAGETV